MSTRSGKKAAGWYVITLGGRTRRAETAAIAVTTLMQHVFGDLIKNLFSISHLKVFIGCHQFVIGNTETASRQDRRERQKERALELGASFCSVIKFERQGSQFMVSRKVLSTESEFVCFLSLTWRFLYFQ